MQKALMVTLILSVLIIAGVASYLYYSDSTDFNINVNTNETDGDNLGLPGSEEPILEPTDSNNEHEQQGPFTFDSVSAGETIKAHYLDHQQSAKLGLHRMDIKVNSAVEDVEISVHSHDTFDKGTAAPGVAFKYPHVEAENLDDSQIDSVKYHFQVPKSWMAANGYSPEQISIYKWDGASGIWVSQKVSYDSQDSTDYFYHVNLKTFGEFAISVD